MADQNLEKLAQVAQIAHLFGGLQDQGQQLSQQDQQARMTLALHALGLQQQAHNESEQRRLQQATIDEAIRNRDATVKGNMADALLSHGMQNPETLPLVSGALEKMGFPELASSAKDIHQANVQKKVTALLPTITAAHAKGGDTYANVLNSVKADPDVWAALQPHLPQDTTAPSNVPIGTKLGRTARSIGKFSSEIPPGSAPFGAVIPIAERIAESINKNNPNLKKDFWSALLGKE